MKFVAIRDLRVRPGEVWKILEREEDLILTSNGKPFAVITHVDEENLEDTLAVLRRRRAQEAVLEIRRSAVRKGLDKINASGIEAEIKEYRRNRRTERSSRQRG